MHAPFVEEDWNGETVLAAERGGAVMAFGVGPRFAGRELPLEDRAARLADGAPPGLAALRWCRQVHGRILASLSAEPGTPFGGAAEVGRCDGLLTAESGLGLAVWTADCVPVLLAGGGVAAAVHSGWRGTAAGVLPAAVRRFQVEYGVPPRELWAALGPSVGACCYQVGEEVVEALRRRGVAEEHWLRGDAVDLRALLAKELAALGLDPGRVERVGPCTACDRRFASYRRDGDRAGRQLSLVVLRA